MMELMTWFQAWLTRHPLKGPAEAERASYTAEVMTRVRALDPPSAVVPASVPVRRWAWWSRFAVAMATTAAVAVTVSLVHQSRSQLATPPLRDVGMSDPATLAESPSPGAAPLWPPAGGHLPRFAGESPSTEEEWFEQTLQLLEQLEEDSSAETAGDGVEEEEWLEELQWLDDSELSTAS